jgi:hypothetical protein
MWAATRPGHGAEHRREDAVAPSRKPPGSIATWLALGGSQSGSQHAQPPSNVRRRPASIPPGERHAGRHEATSGDRLELIWSRRCPENCGIVPGAPPSAPHDEGLSQAPAGHDISNLQQDTAPQQAAGDENRLSCCTNAKHPAYAAELGAGRTLVRYGWRVSSPRGRAGQ